VDAVVVHAADSSSCARLGTRWHQTGLLLVCATFLCENTATSGPRLAHASSLALLRATLTSHATAASTRLILLR